ncbi:cupin domain-containing protein [Chloroflexota bacterium]
MKYLRIYTDQDHKSHFEDVEVDFQRVNFAPPAPPLDVSSFNPATQYAFTSFPAGWHGIWHNTPRRQIFFILSGESEIEVSDGELRQIGPGSVVLSEDTTGEGHFSRVISNTDMLAAVVQLPE